MKRTLYIIGGIVAVVALAIVAWTVLNDSADDTLPPVVADVATPIVDEETDIEEPAGSGEQEPSEEATGDGTTAETGELPPLPRMEGVQGEGSSRGFGGGGGLVKESEAANASPAVAASSMIVAPDFEQIFAEASFVLNATLPVEPTSAVVQQRLFHQVELADARQIADQFGFTGPLYVEVFEVVPRVLPETDSASETATDGGGSSEQRPAKEEPIEFEPERTYHAFDGSRLLNIYSEGITYINREVQVEYGEAVSDAIPTAETFLLERGMLNFPYVLEQGFSDSEVMVYRLVEGMPLQDPEMFVQVASNGEIAIASHYKAFSELAMLGTYPLITAEEAWQLILDGVVANDISFQILPDEAMATEPVLVESASEGPQYWQREILPGSEASLYTWPMVYQRADGQGPPRVEVERFVLAGSDADLQAIAEQRGQMLHIRGQLGVDGTTFTLSGWEAIPDQAPLHMDGTIQRADDQVLFLSSTGETFIVPDAPADLPDGLRVGIFAWASLDMGLSYPVLDWQSIDEWFNFDEAVVVEPMPEPLVVEDDFANPFNFTEITINEVKLSYEIIFDFEDFDQRTRPPEYVQPVWQFNGVTDNGDNISLRVQAVVPEYLASG